MEIEDALKALEWSGASLAKKLGVTPKAVSDWRTKKVKTPPPVRAYLRLAVAVHRIHEELL